MRHALALAAFLAAIPALAWAAGWGGVDPGATTLEEVRQRYGGPTRETRAKLGGYDTLEWVYEGGKAPAGLVRMIVDFGLLTPSGYQPSLVRVLRLEPKPSMFGRQTVLQGWGIPDGATTENERDIFYYKSGLVIVFNKEGTSATSMYFSIPQPDKPAAGPSPGSSDAPASPTPASPPPASPPRQR